MYNIVCISDDCYHLYNDQHLLASGDKFFIFAKKQQYDFCEFLPVCKNCGHKAISHLSGASTKFRVAKPEDDFYACLYSGGVMDTGCECFGYE